VFKGAAPIVLWLLVSVNVAFGYECAKSTPSGGLRKGIAIGRCLQRTSSSW
jgi:hypothetical protein